MTHAQHKLSRRALLAGACALPATTSSTFSFRDPGLRRDDGLGRGERWRRALARYARAEARLGAVAGVEDDAVYDRALGRHNAALARLLRTAAPDLAAAAGKLDLILAHSVFELSFGEACLAALRRDLGRLAEVAPCGRV